MKRAIDIGPVDAAAIRTRGGKVRLRLHFSVEQIEMMLRAALETDDDDEETLDANIEHARRSVTQCDAPEEEKRRTEKQDGDDARARPPPARVFVIEGTRAWEAWIVRRKRDGKPSPPVCYGTGEHAGKRGWYFASLFPPAEPQDSLSDEDVDALLNTR